MTGVQTCALPISLQGHRFGMGAMAPVQRCSGDVHGRTNAPGLLKKPCGQEASEDGAPIAAIRPRAGGSCLSHGIPAVGGRGCARQGQHQS